MMSHLRHQKTTRIGKKISSRNNNDVSATEPDFSNQILVTNHVLTTPKVGDHNKKRKSKHVTPERVTEKDRYSVTKRGLKKNHHKKKVTHDNSKYITLSENEYGIFLSLMKTKSELKSFNEEIMVNVEDHQKKIITFLCSTKMIQEAK